MSTDERLAELEQDIEWYLVRPSSPQGWGHLLKRWRNEVAAVRKEVGEQDAATGEELPITGPNVQDPERRAARRGDSTNTVAPASCDPTRALPDDLFQAHNLLKWCLDNYGAVKVPITKAELECVIAAMRAHHCTAAKVTAQQIKEYAADFPEPGPLDPNIEGVLREFCEDNGLLAEEEVHDEK